MKIRAFFACVIVGFGWMPLAAAPSPSEMAAAEARLTRLDKHLNETFQARLKESADDAQYASDLEEAQRAWRRFLEYYMRTVRLPGAGDPTLDLMDIQARMMAERIVQLGGAEIPEMYETGGEGDEEETAPTAAPKAAINGVDDITEVAGIKLNAPAADLLKTKWGGISRWVNEYNDLMRESGENVILAGLQEHLKDPARTSQITFTPPKDDERYLVFGHVMRYVTTYLCASPVDLKQPMVYSVRLELEDRAVSKLLAEFFQGKFGNPKIIQAGTDITWLRWQGEKLMITLDAAGVTFATSLADEAQARRVTEKDRAIRSKFNTDDLK